MSVSRRIAYVVVMLASILVATWVARKTQSPETRALSRKERLALLIGAVGGGTFAAKLPFLFTDLHALATGRAWLESGRTLTLGLVGGYFGVEIAKFVVGIKAKTGDGFVVPVAVGIGIGRIGCFIAGCCYGTETTLPWGHDFGDGISRHPTELYEAAFHFSCAAFFTWAKARALFVRQRVKIYIIAYFIYRFFTEMIRPEPPEWQELTFYQWTAIAFIPVFLALYAIDARSLSAEGERA